MRGGRVELLKLLCMMHVSVFQAHNTTT